MVNSQMQVEQTHDDYAASDDDNDDDDDVNDDQVSFSDKRSI